MRINETNVKFAHEFKITVGVHAPAQQSGYAQKSIFHALAMALREVADRLELIAYDYDWAAQSTTTRPAAEQTITRLERNDAPYGYGFVIQAVPKK